MIFRMNHGIICYQCLYFYDNRRCNSNIPGLFTRSEIRRNSRGRRTYSFFCESIDNFINWILKMRIQVTLIQKGSLEKIEWTNKWKVVNPYIWEIRNWIVREIIVPEWFITDFWSIPRILWSIFNPTEYHSYILHDYLYRVCILNRSLSDKAMQIWLLSEGAWGIESLIIWLWVRVWWYTSYNKNKYKTHGH